MKKKLLIVTLALVLVLTVMAPSTVLAKADKTWSGEFSATADVVVVDPGTTIPINATATTLTLWTTGEMIEGEFTSADGWSTLKRGALNVTHESVITLDFVTGMFAGAATADIVISFPGNSGELSGTYAAGLTGHFVMVDELIIILDVLDDGTFAVAGRDGGKSIEASGDWIGNLIFTGETLAGTAMIDGEYQKENKAN